MPRTTSYPSLAATESRLRTLFLGALAGEEHAYHAFLGELAAHLRGYLRKRLYQRPDDVEDLVQECLLAVHNQRHTYDPDQPLTAWVYAIARYKWIDHLRRGANREVAVPDFDDETSLWATAATEAADARRDLAKLLDRLPERQRLPIVYVKIEGLSVAEAAQRTGMSVTAVKVAVHRGLKALALLVADRR